MNILIPTCHIPINPMHEKPACMMIAIVGANSTNHACISYGGCFPHVFVNCLVLFLMSLSHPTHSQAGHDSH